jgi:biopolymer transport protein ExbB
MKRFLLFLLMLSTVRADTTVERAVVNTRRDIQQETMALIRERGEIGSQRRALQQELAEREARVTALRQQVERARRVQRQGIDEARRQRLELHTLRQQDADLLAMVREARRSLEAMLPAATASRYQELFREIDAALRGDQPAEALEQLLALYRELHPLLERPHFADSTALSPGGLELEGQTLHIGPLSWFFANQTLLTAGLLEDRPNQTLPRLHPLNNMPTLPALSDGSAELPFDLTDGRALQIDGARRPWHDRLRDGGLTMIPLVLTALASILLIVWKTISLRNVRGLDPKPIQAVAAALRNGDPDTAREHAAAAPQPLRTLLDGALAHPRANAEELEELLHERMLGLMPRLDRHLGTLAVLGGVAPLLGLLGTVTGMIHTFELVTLFGSGNERILSQGISEALVTTMSGLIIAVPVLLAHAFLSRRVRVIISELEQSIALFIQARHHGDPAA